MYTIIANISLFWLDEKIVCLLSKCYAISRLVITLFTTFFNPFFPMLVNILPTCHQHVRHVLSYQCLNWHNTNNQFQLKVMKLFEHNQIPKIPKKSQFGLAQQITPHSSIVFVSVLEIIKKYYRKILPLSKFLTVTWRGCLVSNGNMFEKPISHI